MFIVVMVIGPILLYAAFAAIDRGTVTVALCASGVLCLIAMVIIWLLTSPERYPEKIHWVFRWFPRRTFIQLGEIMMFQRLKPEDLSAQIEQWSREMPIKAPRT